MIPSYEAIAAYRAAIGAPFFSDPWDLNLFVCRSENVGRWDDSVVVAFTDDAGRQVVEAYLCTGDASESEWVKPHHPDGCLWTLPQHVPGGLQLGESKGRPALRQVKPFRYVRWPKDEKRIPAVSDLMALKSFTDNRYTHIHGRVSHKAPPKPQPGDSQACSVLLWRHDLASLIELVRTQLAFVGTDKVSPTYCQFSDLGG